MNISEIRIHPLNGDGKLKAFVSLTIDDAIAIHDIRVIEGDNGLFIAMPYRISRDGSRMDICHPINSQVREEMTEKIIAAYNDYESE